MNWKLVLCFIVGFPVLALLLFRVIVSFLWGVPPYKGPVTAHFDGERFHNPPEGLARSQQSGFARYLVMRLKTALSHSETNPRPYWPDWIDRESGPKPAASFDGLRVTFVNHATFLIQMEGLNILTDPQWSERASPVTWFGPKRHRSPGLRFEDLPKIDVILLSHNHYDHMDLDTLHRLHTVYQPQVWSLLGNSIFLKSQGIPAADLDWWHSTALSQGLELTAVPARHFSSRSLNDRNRHLWGGFVLKGKTRSLYFAGDTAYSSLFMEIGKRFPNLSLALLPIGAYLPSDVMSPVHMSPAEAVQVQVDLGARLMIPMHYGTFRLSEEGLEDPVRDLRAELARRGSAAPVVSVLEEGQSKDIE